MEMRTEPLISPINRHADGERGNSKLIGESPRPRFFLPQADGSAMEKGPKEIKSQTQHPPGSTRRAWKGSSKEPKPNRHTDAFDDLRSLRAPLVVMRETRNAGVELDVVRDWTDPRVHWAVLSVRTSGASGAVCTVHEMSAY